jgi:hypothetical protein
VVDGYKAGPYSSDFEAGSLKDGERKGNKGCEALGERKIGSEAAVGYRIRKNDKDIRDEPKAIDCWVSRGTGLPGW